MGDMTIFYCSVSKVY